MVEQMVLFQIILLLWRVNAFAQAGGLANSSCQEHCGNFSIPFPFGIKAGCYLEDWFAITCKDSPGSPLKPFLRSFNLEVLEIQFEGTVRVNYPISYICSNGTSSTKNEKLARSPFLFSQSKNRFVAMGCNNFASMRSSVDSSVIIGGCMSVCDTSRSITRNASSCNGINCCQTTIPSDLDAFTTNIEPINSQDAIEDCKFAFLVEQKWLENGDQEFASRLNATYRAPVVLEWGLNSTSLYSLQRSNDSFVTYTYQCFSHSTIRSNSSLTFTCACKGGFEGNPYLPEGCEDIDECKEDNPCMKLWSNENTRPLYECQNLFGSYSCQPIFRINSSGFRAKGIIIGVSTGLGVLFLLVGGWFSYKMVKKRKRTKRKEKFFKRNGGLLLQQQLSSSEVNTVENTKLFNSKDLEKATDRFNVNRILGQGGQGTVYKGMLTDGRIVAVKKSKVIDEGKLEEFINEVVILSRINHRNVVKLLGCCLETEVPLLVYEFVPNGTLSQYLHDQNEEFPLTWEMRSRIATEIAGALFYLHSAASSPIYHRDIKSTNILLDDKYRAKVADFGTSRSVAIDQTHLTTDVHGTFGYLDPEYFQSSQFTEKSDVYSFGVVLVELLTGEKAISSTRAPETKSLATYFIRSMEENNLFDILDNRVLKEAAKEEFIGVANLAKRCLNLNGKKRPTMKEVAMELEAVQMSRKASDLQQNYEQTEYVKTEMYEQWDVVSTSTMSGMDSGAASSLGTQPLLSS